MNVRYFAHPPSSHLLPHSDAEYSSYLHCGAKCVKMAILGSQLSHCEQSRAKMQVTRTVGVLVPYKCPENTRRSSNISASPI